MINPPLQYTGIAFTEGFEGCALTSYLDTVADPPVWTIGYGETEGITEGMVWTQEQATAALVVKMNAIAAKICADWSSPTQPNQDEFNPLCDMAYNDGLPALETSTLWRDIMAGDFTSALAQFDRWDMAGGHVVHGLLVRCQARAAEFALGMKEQDDGTGTSTVQGGDAAVPDTTIERAVDPAGDDTSRNV
jgi:lysozyme